MGAAEQTLIVLAVMAVLFVTEIIPLAITSLGGAIALGLWGLLLLRLYSLVYLIVQLCCSPACSLLVLRYSTQV